MYENVKRIRRNKINNLKTKNTLLKLWKIKIKVVPLHY